MVRLRLQGRAALIVAVTSLCGCATPYNFPTPTQVDGQRGFGARGYLKYNEDQEVTKKRIEEGFVRACGGPVEMKPVTIGRADSAVGIKYYSFDAMAKCLTAPTR